MIRGEGEDLRSKMEYTDIKLKGGYGLIKNDLFQLYADLSYFSRNSSLSYPTNSEIEGLLKLKCSFILIGIDGKYVINEKMFLTGNLDFAVSGKSIDDGSTGQLGSDWNADYYIVARLKYTYRFNEKIGATVGYAWSDWKWKGKDESNEDVKITFINTGFALGVTYNF